MHTQEKRYSGISVYEGSLERHDGYVAVSKPTIGGHQPRPRFSREVMSGCMHFQRVRLAISGRELRGSRSSNQSLEGTPAEQGCFAFTVVCRRPSAHRWTLLGTQKEPSQMSAFDCRDSSILGRYAPVAAGHQSESGRSSFQKSTFGA